MNNVTNHVVFMVGIIIIIITGIIWLINNNNNNNNNSNNDNDDSSKINQISSTINTFNVPESNNTINKDTFHHEFYDKHHVVLDRYLGWRKWFTDNKLNYGVQKDDTFQDIPTRNFLDNMKDEPLNNELAMHNINPNIIIY